MKAITKLVFVDADVAIHSKTCVKYRADLLSLLPLEYGFI